jgi:hypothetical protein
MVPVGLNRMLLHIIKDRKMSFIGGRYYNNGKQERRFLEGEKIYDGWVLGRLEKNKKRNINNGKEQLLIPKYQKTLEGWMNGRLMIGNLNVKNKYIHKGDKERRIASTTLILEGW